MRIPTPGRAGYWLTHKMLSQDKNYTTNVVLSGKQEVFDALQTPTLFFANHTSAEDSLRIHHAITREQKAILGEKPPKMIRTVIADDIYLDDSIPLKDRPRNFGINLGAWFSNQILMKRKTSKNKRSRQPAIKSIVQALYSRDDVLVFPMSSFSVDGSVDFIRDNNNKVLDRDTYNKIHSFAPSFHLQPVHYVFDPVSETTIITLNGGRDAKRDDYDFLADIKGATTLTPLQLATSYLAMAAARSYHPDLEKKVNDLNRLMDFLDNDGMSVFVPKGQDTSDAAFDAFAYISDVLHRTREPYHIQDAGRLLRADTPEYLANQVAHMNLDHIVEAVVTEGKWNLYP